MPSLNFQKRFADDVESGRKQRSIRAPRKRPLKVGDRLALYTGMRTKGCRLLGRGVVTAVSKVLIECECTQPDIRIDERWLSKNEVEELATADGFERGAAMAAWFEATHGLPFHGDMIEWELQPRASGTL